MQRFPRRLPVAFRSCFQLPSRYTTENPKPSQTAEAREDFIKRLFAVTLSVGIASQVVHIMFDPSHISPKYDWVSVLKQWKTILLLLISLTIVVSSWEGYLGAIKRMPLEDAFRFWVDIALVFSYLVLTLSSQIYNLWFSIHMVIFFEYLLWDVARSNLAIYKNLQKEHPQPQHQLSMVITIVWLAYFAIILCLKNYIKYFDGSLGFTAIAMAALAGVILYRLDKKYRWRWTCKIVAGFSPLLVLTAAAYLEIG